LVHVVLGLLPVDNFPILPSDNLWSLFDLDQGCLEDEVERFLESVAPGAPQLAASPGMPPPQTVSDLVGLVYTHAKPYLVI
jgi:hypothetical protein